MPIKYKKLPSDSSWTTPAAGSIKVKATSGATSWSTAISVKEKKTTTDTSWTDSGYVAYPFAASSFSGSGGNGDTKKVTFTWSAPTSGATVTGYRLYIYNSSDSQIATADTGNVTSYDYTFGAANTTYYVRLKTLGAAGESQTFATNSSSGTRLSVVTGSPSTPYDNSRWSDTLGFTPGYWTQSTWPGSGYGDYTYYGDKAFDGDGNTYWQGQSWAWPGGNDWIGFYISALPTAKIKVVSLVNWSPGGWNSASSVTMDQWDGANFNWIYIAWDGSSYFYGGQVIGCNFEIAAGSTGYYRLYYTNLGYNPSAYGGYRVGTATIAGTYQYWITDTGTTPATANTVSNA